MSAAQRREGAGGAMRVDGGWRVEAGLVTPDPSLFPHVPKKEKKKIDDIYKYIMLMIDTSDLKIGRQNILNKKARDTLRSTFN